MGLPRLRLRHSRFTHTYLMSRMNTPYCSRCNAPFSLKHILEECPSYAKLLHLRVIPRNHAKALRDDNGANAILRFLKMANLFHYHKVTFIVDINFIYLFLLLFNVLFIYLY